MAYTNPTVSDFQAQFIRDFPYGIDPDVAVLDQDITNAFTSTNILINQGLWPDQTSYNLGYLLLSAHFLVLNLRNSSQGLNGQYNWAENSKSVSGISESFTLPPVIVDNPNLMAYTKTNYGAAYLNLLWPLLCGQMFSVFGPARA